MIKVTNKYFFVRKPERKSQFGKPRCRWNDTIGMEITEIGWEGVGWINLSQEREQWHAGMNTLKNLWIPQNAINFLTSFSRWTVLLGVSHSSS
jgi:hypothetical protein